TCMNCASTRAPQTASAWPTIQSTKPGIHSCRPSPTAAAKVPLAIATVRGAPPSRIGSASERCSGTSKPGRSVAVLTGLPSVLRTAGLSAFGAAGRRSYDSTAGEAEERQEERGGGERDGQAKDDLDQLAKAARGVA